MSNANQDKGRQGKVFKAAPRVGKVFVVTVSGGRARPKANPPPEPEQTAAQDGPGAQIDRPGDNCID